MHPSKILTYLVCLVQVPTFLIQLQSQYLLSVPSSTYSDSFKSTFFIDSLTMKEKEC